MDRPFVKMHGLGNDFVVVDARDRPLVLDAGLVRAIADRRTGVGCDQLITLERSERADAFMRIHNADGGEVEACGNATRCVGVLLMRESGGGRAAVETLAGVLEIRAGADGLVSVDMGPPRLGWRDIPLAREMDTTALDFALGGLTAPGAVNMGNPHVSFFVPDLDAVPLADLGPRIEHDPLFPERVNVGVAQVLSPGRLRLRVWERGAGLTRACGTNACATLVAAVRRELCARRAEVVLDGGPLDIEWAADGHVWMTGPVSESFRGVLHPSLLGGRAA